MTPTGEDNPAAKLTQRQADNVRWLWKVRDNVTMQEIADALDVDRMTVHRILTGEIWTNEAPEPISRAL